jgi:hypothetical protein
MCTSYCVNLKGRLLFPARNPTKFGHHGTLNGEHFSQIITGYSPELGGRGGGPENTLQGGGGNLHTT